ncbi:hypothetical protein O9992_28985 [Vibrio lentus]|nr:hypothetical protein [Vibrio lentus]
MDKRVFWQKLITLNTCLLQTMLFSLLGVVDIFMVNQLGDSLQPLRLLVLAIVSSSST